MAHSRGLDLDLEILKRLSRDKLIRILEESAGTKDLVIDGDLMKLLDRIADAQTLRSHGVDRMFRLERVPPPSSASQIVYLVKPSLFNIKFVADHIHTLRSQNQLQIHLVCVPRIVSWATLLLEEEGLYGKIFLHEFTPEFIPLDEDLLSLEMNSFFKDAFQDGDFSGCLPIARALNTIQSLYGNFRNIFGHGRAAEGVLKALEFIQGQQNTKNASTGVKASSQLGHLFVFDRDVDYVTPLLTQLTYEGALDEFYGIKAGIVEFPKEIVENEHPSKVALNSSDTIFDNIRNRHFAGVSGHLVRRARELQAKRLNTSSMTPAQMKEFVSNELRTIQSLQKSLSLHISACEGINKNTRKDFDVQLTMEHGMITEAVNVSTAKSYIEDCIARQVPHVVTLRLLCLYSITQKGLTRKDYEALSTQLLASYGHYLMLSLYNLRQSGLLLLEDSAEEQTTNKKQKQMLHQVISSLSAKKIAHWYSLSRKLKLIPDGDADIDLHNPTSMSYVFNGAYTPAIPQLISEALSKSFNSVADVLKLVPGTTVSTYTSDEAHHQASRVLLVVLLGGVTYTEIAALRLLAVNLSVKIIIASTCTITGNSLIKSAIVAK